MTRAPTGLSMLGQYQAPVTTTHKAQPTEGSLELARALRPRLMGWGCDPAVLIHHLELAGPRACRGLPAYPSVWTALVNALGHQTLASSMKEHP